MKATVILTQPQVFPTLSEQNKDSIIAQPGFPTYEQTIANLRHYNPELAAEYTQADYARAVAIRFQNLMQEGTPHKAYALLSLVPQGETEDFTAALLPQFSLVEIKSL
ncbi:MAG TPA: hypothetical protein V6D30_04955 [Leptolyngbyaceae cyanobacterium]